MIVFICSTATVYKNGQYVCLVARKGAGACTMFPTSTLSGDPLALSSLCSGNDVPNATCLVVVNTTDETVAIISAGRSGAYLLKPYEILSGTFITGSTITATGETSKQVYVDKRTVQGKEQTIYVEKPLPTVTQVKTGSFPWLALTIISALIIVALGLAIGLTNAKVDKQCPVSSSSASSSSSSAAPSFSALSPSDVDVDKILSSLTTQQASLSETPQIALEQSAGPSPAATTVVPTVVPLVNRGRSKPPPRPCTVEQNKRSKLSWWLLLIPVLVFVGALIGYILLQANVLNKVTIAQCKARAGGWQSGYYSSASSTNRNLCRMFGVCDCINRTAQQECGRFAVLLANGQVFKRVTIPPPDGLASTEHDTRIRNAVRAATKEYQRQNAGRQLADVSGGMAPYYRWNQSVANQQEKYRLACCPTADAPSGSECYDCTSGTCYQGQEVTTEQRASRLYPLAV